jgi:hypothetical protein
MDRMFPGELISHLEFVRFRWRHHLLRPASGAFTTEERLEEIMDLHNATAARSSIRTAIRWKRAA